MPKARLHRITTFVLLVVACIGLGGILFTASNRLQQQDRLQESQLTQLIQAPLPTESIEPPFQPSKLHFSDLFAADQNWVASLSAERITTIVATGDVLPARTVNKLTSEKNDWNWPYIHTADVLSAADITFINLETPLIQACPIILGGFKFCGDQRNVAGLLTAGVDVVTLANNHANNYGVAGIEETIELLHNSALAVVGVTNQPSVLAPKNTRFAFLGYNDVGVQPEPIAAASAKAIRADIQNAKLAADVVIVQFHWGEEYRYQPTLRQQDLGHLAIDAGADLVIGNHPHWFQAVEQYHEGLIAYSHGNFVFDQEWSIETKQGIVGRYTFYDDQLLAVEFLPIRIEDYGQPHFLVGDEKASILAKLQAESELLRTAVHENQDL